MVERIRPSFARCTVYQTICDTTVRRQEEAIALSKHSDVMIVVGGAHSSNTQKLFDLCSQHCRRTYALKSSKDSRTILEKIHRSDIISVVAGASTPNWMIMEVVTSMSELEKTVAEVANEAAEEVTAPAEAPEAIAVEAPIATETEADAADAAEDDFKAAFEKTLVRIRNGQILTGTVVQIVDEEVCVNIGFKSDGFIPRNEFSFDSDVIPSQVVKVGDEIEVEVLKVNDGEGNVLLSHKSVESKKAWDKFIENAEGESAVFDAVGKEVVKGGLIANIEGIRAFVPASQVSNRYVENLAEYVGKPHAPQDS